MFAAVALHIWQSTLVLIVAWMLALTCRRNAAAVRYTLWFTASLKFLIPFAFLNWMGDRVGRSLPKPPELDPTLMETGRLLFGPAAPPFDEGVLPPFFALAFAIWAAGAALLLLNWVRQWRAVRAMLAFAPLAPLDRPVPVRIAASNLSPGVFGVLRPVVVLPEAVVRTLSAQQVNAVLAHEIAHVHRWDNLTAAIHKCVEAIFWFYPPVWWIGAHLLREREAACDEAVLEAGYERAVYAESLLLVCRLSAASNVPALAASTGGCLTQRLRSIMSKDRTLPIDNMRCAALFAAAALLCYGPITGGIVTGAIRESMDSGPITFETVRLEPSGPAWRRTTHFDAEVGRLALNNFSLRDLISLAYPGSRVNSESDLIDGIYYDIEARWRDQGRASERNVYRELLKSILRTNSNLLVYVKDRCEGECDGVPRQLIGGRRGAEKEMEAAAETD
jgi:beta-lactamase regulating signal transducer with metallopeptidase domain